MERGRVQVNGCVCACRHGLIHGSQQPDRQPADQPRDRSASARMSRGGGNPLQRASERRSHRPCRYVPMATTFGDMDLRMKICIDLCARDAKFKTM